MDKLTKTYKVIRGILFSAVALVAVVFVTLYILLSLPSFQSYVKQKVEKEASAFLGADLKIGSLSVRPFNEVVLSDVTLSEPGGGQCVSIETVGAGISLWRLLADRRVVLTYAEIIGLQARIVQQAEDSPLNIQFLIDAFKPKDKNKPPSAFSLRLYNVVIRNSGATFDRVWLPVDSASDKTDFNHLRLSDLRADLTCPRISQDDIRVDLRRLAFNLSGGLEVQTLSFKAHYTPHNLELRDFLLRLPGTEIKPNDIALSYRSPSEIAGALLDSGLSLSLVDNKISLPDFGWLVPDLRKFPVPWTLTLEAQGTRSHLDLGQLSLSQDDGRVNILATGSCDNLDSVKSLKADLTALRVTMAENELPVLLSRLPFGIKSRKLEGLLGKTGRIALDLHGEADLGKGIASAQLDLSSSRLGSVALKGAAREVAKGRIGFNGSAQLRHLEAGELASFPRLGQVNGEVSFTGSTAGRDVNGEADISIDSFFLGGVPYDGFTAAVSKSGKEYEADLYSDSSLAYADIQASAFVDGPATRIDLHADVKEAHPGIAVSGPLLTGSALAFRLDASLEGLNADDLAGNLELNDFEFFHPSKGRLNLNRLEATAETLDSLRLVSLRSDWLDGDIRGNFKIKDLVQDVKDMGSRILPALLPPSGVQSNQSDIAFDFTLKPDNSWTEFFKLPVRLLVPVPLTGHVDGTARSAGLNVDVPFLQQGKNKLIRDTRLTVTVRGDDGSALVEGTTTFPGKKGDMSLGWTVEGRDNDISCDLSLKSLERAFLSGALSLDASLSPNPLGGRPDVTVNINPSTLGFGNEQWKINPSAISFANGVLRVNDLKIDHGPQFIEIGGVASALPGDSVAVRLASVDIGYIFDTLNINYVTFSGVATGGLSASGVFGKEPRALTDGLFVKGLSYNGAVLGDAVIKSHWDNDQKEVTIDADIQGERGRQKVAGGIWVTRDSLSFAIDADRVPVGFMKPFMAAFSSDLRGHASGKAKLFGTFSDIDLTGDIFADSLALKLDYTNVWYHGSDSVRLRPGHITIPSFRLYDEGGRSAILTGDLTHRYFHDPKFNFRVSDARGLLCYNTNASMNPDWYGRIYGNGGAVIKGWPGTVSVSVDMSATGKSDFTFVLNDTEAAEDYRFLSFTDKKKEEAERLKADSLPPGLAAFRKKVELKNEAPSKFMLDIRGSVTPTTLFTLVMDPIAGDKITARGNGNLQVEYDSESNDMKLFGKYILEEGNYNFSLQDLFLRDFTIRRGSSISFNGDPLNAMLDITAAYRVNTNLSDLDKSFSTDRDLARTSVPVDALLMVDGNMQHPDITFDIELPTLTQDVERKVKSIISTEDMMSRQIIYLLALQRFYTPEYMGSSGNGSEFAAVASSTLSTQLSNILGQLTDKFTLSPTFRSDKGDFSDLEVDVALSSRLLNNRLLINGNFGYRDKSTSTTTFVGDFDIEYLLSRNGNLRLKAYNHFNDQNYYLRQALTTQGLGVIFRKDFDNPFSFLKRRKKKVAAPLPLPGPLTTDSLPEKTIEKK